MPGFDEVLKAYTARHRALVEADFPGMPGERVAVRLLTDEELDAVAIEAVRHIKALGLDTYVDGDQRLDAARQQGLIQRAFFRPGESDDRGPIPFFSSVETIREELTPDTRAQLLALYEEHALKVAGAEPRYSDEALETFRDALTERPAEHLLSSLARADLVALIDGLVAKLKR